MRSFLILHWEWLLAVVLFLACAYGAVFFVTKGELGMAGFLIFCAYGFAHAVEAFGLPDVAKPPGRGRQKS